LAQEESVHVIFAMLLEEKAALSLVTESFVSTADKQVQELLAAGSILEVLS
jgi:hypothetical protein